MKTILSMLAIVAGASACLAQTNTPPSFSLAWSEYPSWSILDVASSRGIIDGRKGHMGPIEKKHDVDIVLKFMDYDPCIQAYSSSDVDAVCITNTDILSPSLGRKSVAILPTSTSYGADALIVPNNVSSVQDLKGQTVYGLSASVSQFVFAGILEANGMSDNDVVFSNMDPSAAAQAVQNNDAKVQNIIVWNPFVLETLRKRKDVRVLEDSRTIPFQVIDMVVIGEDVLNKTGGERFAVALCETFYEINKSLNSADQSIRDETLIAVGEKFSNLGIADMRKVIQQTRFFGSPESGVALFEGKPLIAQGDTILVDGKNISSTVVPVLASTTKPTTLPDLMKTVVDRCTRLGILTKPVTISYNADPNSDKSNVRFDSRFMKATMPQVETPNKGGKSPLDSPHLGTGTKK